MVLFSGKVTIAAIGPLTNIAMAINLDPTFSSSIRDLWVMGGNIKGELGGRYIFVLQ
jgi:purine nucleosidase